MSTISKFLANPPDNFSTQISSSTVATGALSIDLDSTAGLPTEGVGQLFKKDSSGNVVQGSIEFIHWTGALGNTITLTDTGDRGLTGSDSGAQSYVADDYFEVWVSSYYQPTDGILVEHAADGTHDDTVVATLTGTQTLTNKTLTSPTITSPTITGTPVLNADSAVPFYNSSMARQAIINGNQDVWQRGTSVALTAANGYTADRWYVETATAGTDKTVSREDGTGVPGSYYCARVAMVQDVDELLTFSQALESQDSIKFRGKKLTLSFYARGGAEFVADNATLVSKIVTGKGTDQKVLAFTTSADAVSQNNTLTTGWQKFTCTTTEVIAADITQVGVSLAFTHAGSGTTTNYFEITQVQLCAGDVALPFQPKSYEEELRACQRYYEKSYDFSVAPGTNVGAVNTNGEAGGIGFTSGNWEHRVLFSVKKRTQPTIVAYTPLGTSGSVRNYTTSADLAAAYLARGETGFRIGFSSGTVNANNLIVYHWTAESEL